MKVKSYYTLIGPGCCTNWIYLPGGGENTAFLSEGDEGYPPDKTEECANRCWNAARDDNAYSTQAFYVNSLQLCACSRDACDSQRAGQYTSYRMTQVFCNDALQYVVFTNCSKETYRFPRQFEDDIGPRYLLKAEPNSNLIPIFFASQWPSICPEIREKVGDTPFTLRCPTTLRPRIRRGIGPRTLQQPNIGQHKPAMGL